MNSWYLSGLVNLLGAGVSWATAKALILTSVATDQTVAGTACEAAKTNMTTLAGLGYGARSSNAANTIGYCINSPYQTYAHI